MNRVMMWLCLKEKSPYLIDFLKYIKMKEIYSAMFIITKLKLGLSASTDSLLTTVAGETTNSRPAFATE